MAAGFTCGCWLGVALTPEAVLSDILTTGGKYAPLLAAAAVLRRRRSRRTVGTA